MIDSYRKKAYIIQISNRKQWRHERGRVFYPETMTEDTTAYTEKTCNIDIETATHIKNYVSTHEDFLQRTLKFGSPLQRAKALIFFQIAKGEVTL